MREESETLVAAAEHEAVGRLPRPECLGVAAPPPRKSVDISGENCCTAETIRDEHKRGQSMAESHVCYGRHRAAN